MRILILGGTVFLGRHVAAEALARGHELTLFTRGLHGADLFPEAEHVRGDRADVSPLRGRDVGRGRSTPPATSPRTSRQSAPLDVGHYVFVSTCNVYPRLAGQAGRRGLADVGRGRGLRRSRRRVASARWRRCGRAGGRPCAPG